MNKVITLISSLLCIMALVAASMLIATSQAQAGFSDSWPDLTVTSSSSSWGSYSDYLARRLTASFTLNNSSVSTWAPGVQITGVSSTGCVSLETATPGRP